MNSNRFALLAFPILLASAGVYADAPDGKRVVNDKNCRHESLVDIKDKADREEFASRCLRRGSFKPSTKKEW